MLEIFKDSHYADNSFFFKFHKYLMRFLGYWPGDPSAVRSILLCIFAEIFELFFCTFELNFAYQNSDNLGLMLDALTGTTTRVVTAIKLLILLYHREKISELLSKLKQYFEDDRDEESVKINSRLCKVNNIFVLILLTFTTLTGTFYLIIPLVKDLMLYLNGQPLVRGMPYKAHFPEFFRAAELPNYVFIFLGSGFSGYLTVAGISAVDGIFLGLCLHISGQFQIIVVKLNQLMTPFEATEKCTPRENKVIYTELTKIIDHHRVIIGLSRQLSNAYATIVLLHFISASFTICICCITILLSEGFDKLIFINYIIAATTQALVYAIGGEILVETSTSVQLAAYETDWYKCDQKIKKSLLFIMMRAGKPSGVDVPFFKVSMETFASILYSANAYITLLNKFL